MTSCGASIACRNRRNSATSTTVPAADRHAGGAAEGDSAIAAPSRRIFYLPGQNPKPPPAIHAPQLWRCLLEGCRRADAELARELAREPEIFRLLGWNSIFYAESQDIGPDLPWIDLVRQRTTPDERDIRAARAWNKRFLRLLYGIADRMPWLVDLIPDPHMKNTLQQANRYFENHHGLAEEARGLLIDAVSEAWREQVPICVIGHSLGSVIAFDALWELDHIEHSRAQVDLFLTFGSPLGSNFVRKRMLGAGYEHGRRVPGNIRTWVNLPAVGDHISLDKDFEQDFGEMLNADAVHEILQPTKPLYNLYRDENGLNPHRAYGYLCHREAGAAIQNWCLRGRRRQY